MNIVIVGAGDIGIYLATLFSQLHYGIVLIDIDPVRLEQATRDLDVATRLGSGTDWELLEELLEFNPDLLVALTNADEKNLTACMIAKHLGYAQTIARVRSNKYFMQTRLHFERLFAVDHLIGPEKLTAHALANMILVKDTVETKEFAHGSVIMRTLRIPVHWRKGEFLLKQRKELELPGQSMVGLIRRIAKPEGREKHTKVKEHIIFPHGDASLLPEDEATFIGEPDAIQKLHKLFGISTERPQSVIIVGGSLIGINLAKLLQEKKIRVRILEKDFQKCRSLSEKLPYSTIIHRDGTDYRFLQSEKAGEADVFVACTRQDEVNFLAGSIAKQLGCKEVILSLSDTNYLPLVGLLGIKAAVSPRLQAANRILSIAREKTITSTVSMYENKAEIMEVKVSIGSKIAGIPIQQLGPQLPEDFLIAVIQSRGRVFIADGTRVMSPGDTVIVISSPKHVESIKQLF